ncbi:hypothetical protein DPMN_097559 [Dreissena polymorpha]|uniref:Uncharacterized protein n=1 Tax=Dreissena polymorpha TaxID=45954 RepID=A0A9D4R4U8_DREPO|nr:hypothetical protein DPMN_097559 [Dreissena polymorpha]
MINVPMNSHIIQLTGTIFELNSRFKETNVLSKFHENWAKNVTSTVFTCFHYIHIEKNAPPTGGHVFPPIPTIFKLVRDINKTNVLTNFYDDWAKIVPSRVFTRENCHYIHIEKNAPPTGSHRSLPFSNSFETSIEPMFSPTFMMIGQKLKTAPFELGRDFIGTKLLTKFHEDGTRNVASRTDGRTDIRRTKTSHKSSPEQSDIIGTNLLTKFHKDRKINVASRVLTRKNAPPPGSHVFQPTGIIFELFQDIIRMNLLTKFHEDRTVNVASRVLTRFYYSHIRKNDPPLGSHINLLTKFHEDWIVNKPLKEKCPAPGGHVFKATKTIFELIQDIIGTNLLTKFHDDRKINVTSRVLTRKIAPPPIIFELVQDIIGMNLLTKFHEDQTINVASRVKNAPPLDIIKTNLLTIFHQDWTINVASRLLTRKNAPLPGGHVFQPTGIIFELFHEDWTINVASRVLTRFYYSHIRKNAPPLGSHVVQAKVTIFELIQDISGTNLLSKFHEDRKINVASRVITRKNAPPP